MEHIHQNVIPIQAAAADSAYDFPLAHRVLEEHGIAFFVRSQSAHDRPNVELKQEAFSYDAGQYLPRRETTAAEYTASQCQRAVLALSGG